MQKTPPSLLSSLNSKITKSMLCKGEKTEQANWGVMKASLHASREKRSLEVTEQNFVTKDKQKKPPNLASSEEKKEVERTRVFKKNRNVEREQQKATHGLGLFLFLFWCLSDIVSLLRLKSGDLLLPPLFPLD
jgi:hypothetical protein